MVIFRMMPCQIFHLILKSLHQGFQMMYHLFLDSFCKVIKRNKRCDWKTRGSKTYLGQCTCMYLQRSNYLSSTYPLFCGYHMMKYDRLKWYGQDVSLLAPSSIFPKGAGLEGCNSTNFTFNLLDFYKLSVEKEDLEIGAGLSK